MPYYPLYLKVPSVAALLCSYLGKVGRYEASCLSRVDTAFSDV